MAYFNAVQSGSSIGDGTRGALQTWLERYINILFPENGIEYWSLGAECEKEMVPAVGGENRIRQFACFATRGHCEGYRIEACALLQDGTYVRLASIKTFGKQVENWAIAEALSEALDSIYFYNEVPELVAMADSLPREHQWSRETNLTSEVAIDATPTSLVIKTPEAVLWTRDFADQGDNAKWAIDAYLKDWRVILGNMRARLADPAVVA